MSFSGHDFGKTTAARPVSTILGGEVCVNFVMIISSTKVFEFETGS